MRCQGINFWSYCRMEFKSHKLAYVMIPYNFKYSWNTSVSCSYLDFLEGKTIASSPFPIDALREDECPIKDFHKFLGSSFFSRIRLTLALASTELPWEESGYLFCVTPFLHCIHTNMSLDHGHYLKGRQQTKITCRKLLYEYQSLLNIRGAKWDLYTQSPKLKSGC